MNITAGEYVDSILFSKYHKIINNNCYSATEQGSITPAAPAMAI